MAIKRRQLELSNKEFKFVHFSATMQTADKLFDLVLKKG